jgi:hypothetical protein
MPKIRQYTEKYAQDDFVKEIGAKSVWAGFRTNEELANAVGVSAASVGNYKRDPGKIQIKTMQKMISVLRLDPEIVLRYLGYSTQDIKKLAKNYIQ